MVVAARAQFSLVSRILYRPSDRRCASNHFAAIRRHYRFHSHVLEAGPRGNMAVRALCRLGHIRFNAERSDFATELIRTPDAPQRNSRQR